MLMAHGRVLPALLACLVIQGLGKSPPPEAAEMRFASADPTPAGQGGVVSATPAANSTDTDAMHSLAVVVWTATSRTGGAKMSTSAGSKSRLLARFDRICKRGPIVESTVRLSARVRFRTPAW